MSKEIDIYLFKPGRDTENFGEYLCEQIINHIGYKCNKHWLDRPSKANTDILTAIGGLYNNLLYRRFDKELNIWYVWGSGLECRCYPNIEVPKKIQKEKCFITMLRGPLTRDYYNYSDDILLGDPGYLTSSIFERSSENKNVFVQFYKDKTPKTIPGVDIHLSTLLRGDFKSDFDTIIRYISSANIVMTSSMHIMIAAHSYGVPWALASKESANIKEEWKWCDTLMNVGLDKSDIKLCSSVEEGLEWWNSIKHKITPITKEYQEQILEAFPLK